MIRFHFYFLMVSCLTAGLCTAQADSTYKDFTLDSTGCMGLRGKHVRETDSIPRTSNVLVDHQDLICKTRREILAMLGKPNSIENFWGNQREPQKDIENGNWEYYLCLNKLGGISILICFRFNRVSGVVLRMYCG
ncbi:MAG: hypothetical protein ACJ77K_10860 [Bacteroidia bacterium]|jgi:hypothetical protein